MLSFGGLRVNGIDDAESPMVCCMESLLLAVVLLKAPTTLTYKSGKPCQRVEEGCHGRRAEETPEEKPEGSVSTTTASAVAHLPQLL